MELDHFYSASNNVSASIKETVDNVVQGSHVLMSWWWGQSSLSFQSGCDLTSWMLSWVCFETNKRRQYQKQKVFWFHFSCCYSYCWIHLHSNKF